MNKLALVLAVLTTLISAQSAAAATYVRWGDVDGSAVRATTSATTRVSAPTVPQEASTDYLLKIDGVKGETEDTKKGSSAPAPEPESAKVNKIDAITVKQGVKTEAAPETVQQPATGETSGKDKGHKQEIEILSNSNTAEAAPDGDEDAILGMVILTEATTKGGVNIAVGDVNGITDETRAKIAVILKEGMEETGAPVEQVSLNFEKITVKLKQDVKLFGFIPMSSHADVDVDVRGNTTISRPWWSFLAAGKDDQLGPKVVTVLKAAIESKQAALKLALGYVSK